MSPFLQKHGIALNMVESPYEYRIESGVPKNFAILASQSRWTSKKEICQGLNVLNAKHYKYTKQGLRPV